MEKVVKYRAKSVANGMAWLSCQKKLFAEEAQKSPYLEMAYSPSYPNKVHLNKVTRVRDILCNPARTADDPSMVVSYITIKIALFAIQHEDQEISMLYREGNIFYYFGVESQEGYAPRYCARCGNYISQDNIDSGICPHCKKKKQWNY